MFRAKMMELEEWVQFQNLFGDFQLRIGGDPAYAVFREQGSHAQPSTILIPDHDAATIEALSPGGWENCSNASQRKWELLMGDSRAHELFGLPSAGA